VTDFPALLKALSEASVDFIVIGGAAAVAHGAARLTLDLDIVYGRSRDNLERLTSALAPLKPYPRGAPPGLPFRWDAVTIRNGLNFTLETTAGDVDLLGEITGGGGYDDLKRHCIDIELYGARCKCLQLDKLIEVKRAAGRPKDFEAIAELEVIRRQREAPN
jgi:predicted nucleotidyltransferase